MRARPMMSFTPHPVVGLVEYGMGNLRSVANAIRFLGGEVRLLPDPAGLATVDLIVLPGVGAFGDGIANLRFGGFVPALEAEVLGKKKPFLGICLGMQLLATTGLEYGRHRGLNWIPGVVDKIPIPVEDRIARLPHIGWNDVRFSRDTGIAAGLPNNGTFYFVHSYQLWPEDWSAVCGVCTHGSDFAAVIQVGNIVATQFHPEKSQKAGLALLRNFLRMTAGDHGPPRGQPC